jgi:hypothetical protein
MDFSEITRHLLNGKRIRRTCWEDSCYFRMEDDGLVDNNGNLQLVLGKDIIAKDWELFEPKIDMGTVIQYNDGTIGIVLDKDASSPKYTILDENGCVETVDETQISLINIDDGRVKFYIKSVNEFLTSVVSTLQTISELVN